MSARRTSFGDTVRPGRTVPTPDGGELPAPSRQYPGWSDPPLPGGPTPTTPGGQSTVKSGTGLHSDTLVGPRHRVPILYGRCLISPDLVKAASEHAGATRGRYHVVISEGPIDAIESWYGASSFQSIVTTLGSLSTPAGMQSWTVGLAAAEILTKSNQPWFPRCIARGRKPYDPRLGAWGAGVYPDSAKCAYSTNPALAYVDLRVFPQYGCDWPKVSPSLVDWTSVSDAADYFDEDVDGEKRYELNLYLQDAANADQWLKTIELHAGLHWREQDGLYRLDYSAPVATVAAAITRDDVVKGSSPKWSYGSGAGLADRPNRFRAEWIDPASNWPIRTVEVRHPEVDAGAAIRDGAVYQLHGFHSEAMAQRALWRIAHEIWSEQEFECELTTSRLDLVEGTRVPVTLASLGLSAVDHIVTRVGYDSDRIRITARRYDSTTWTPDASNSGTLPDDGFFDTPPALTSVARATPETVVSAVTPTSKTTISYLGFQWQLPTFAFPDKVVIRIWPAGTSPSWDTAGYVEITEDARGEPRYAADPTWKKSCRPTIFDTTVLTFDSLGAQIATASSGAGYAAILKLRSMAGVESTGVAISEAAHSTSGSTPATQEPVLMSTGFVATSGQIAVWDDATGEVTFPAALAIVAPGASASIGGRMLIGTTVTLTADLAAAATTIYVNRNTLANGDRIMLEGAPGGVTQVEWMAVTSAASGAGPYSYTVTRNLDGSGANDWKKGDAIFNTKQTGAGWIDLYSLRGMKAATEVGPTIVGNIRDSATWNAWTPRWAIGNLNGIYGYSADTYGAAFGIPSGAWLKIDPTNGIRIGHNTTTKVQVNASGSASFAGGITAESGTIGGVNITASKLYLGTGSFFNSNTPFFVNDTGDFSLSNKFKWDGTNLTVLAGNVTLDGNGIQIPQGGLDGANGYNIAASGTTYGGVYGSSGNLLVGRISGTMLQFESARILAVGYHEADGFTTRSANPGSGYFDSANGYKVTGAQVVGPREAAVADATDATSVIARLNDLLARLRSHGLIYSS